jgi:hypothetical protein
MNVWLPGALVVAAGLAAGFWYALRAKGDGPASPRSPGEASSGAGTAGLAAADSAARTDSAPDAVLDAVSDAMPPFSRRSAFIGFLVGVASTLILGALVHWATVGSKPRPEEARVDERAPMSPGPPGLAAAPDATSPEEADRAHDESSELAPEVRAQLDPLRARVEAAPQDLNARRQFAVALLNSNQLMEAFEQARELQRLVPDDADGLFVEGVVRLAMGQWPISVQLMDRVLAQHPDHVLASLAKGQAQAALGQLPQAIATWKRGLAAAGGSYPPIEEMIAQAEAAGSAAPGAGPTAGAAFGASAPAEVSGAGSTYRVHIELAPGTVGPRGQGGAPPTLFVALRGEAPGPPAAVKRVDNPAFPLELALTSDDSMMGQPLPEKGSLSIHLDGDGNASTREDGDLAASVPVFSGTPVTVVLESGGR